MKQNFKKQGRFKAFSFLFVLVLLFGFQSINAQTTVTGTVTDDQGPLSGASVVVKGTTAGASADFDGK